MIHLAILYVVLIVLSAIIAALLYYLKDTSIVSKAWVDHWRTKYFDMSEQYDEMSELAKDACKSADERKTQ